ncbi:ATP-dependent helicase [Patescibacteria group bacterium]|nr:MAG: ATP-dependent helicase [Patescibacteria group bacterium]
MKEFVLKDAPAGARKIDYAGELNPEQLAVVEGGDGPCLVLAGAGSGKTRTVTYRVAYLLEGGVRPDEILLLTFTNKAAKEMLDRVEGLLGAGATGIWGGTFHSVANRLLRQYAPLVSRTPSFTILDEEDARDLIKLCVKEADVDTTARRFPSPAVLKGIASYARNATIPVRDALTIKHPHFSDLAPVVERIAELYEARKAASDAVDFDDLLVLLLKLLRERPDVRDRLADRFRYVLVDEYQDTNALQAHIVRELSLVHRNLLVVGDDAQSIYSFRAADIRNILAFPELFPGATTFRLLTNYRSTPDILALANGVIAHNRDQFKKELRAVRPHEEKPSLVPAGTDAEEARYIAEQALQLRDEGTPLCEIAVLFRASFHSQSLEFELMKRDIPYEYRGGMKFFERAHVKDLVAHLRLIANPKDEAAWMRVLSLQGGIGLVTAGKIVDGLRGAEGLEAVLARCPVSGKAARGWEAARDVLRKAAAAGGPSGMIREVAGSGYRDYLEAEYPDFRDRLDDLEQFALFADGYESLTSFLDEVSLTDQYGAARGGSGEAQDEEKMVLTTIHQAKGLEWDAVFVMGLADGKFPNPRALEEQDGLEEERRLLYVAITRARRRLFLTYPIASMTDAFSIGAPSPLVTELPQGLAEEVRLRHAPRTAPPSRSRWGTDEEPMIVLDALGEKKTDVPYRGLLRNVDDL